METKHKRKSERLEDAVQLMIYQDALFAEPNQDEYTSIDGKILKIVYNSPGEIAIELSKKVALQVKDILNTVIFYSQKKRQQELETLRMSQEYEDLRLASEEKAKFAALRNLEAELEIQLSLISKLNDLRKN